MSFDQKYFDHLSFHQLSFGQILFEKMSFGQISSERMSSGQIWFEQMSKLFIKPASFKENVSGGNVKQANVIRAKVQIYFKQK